MTAIDESRLTPAEREELRDLRRQERRLQNTLDQLLERAAPASVRQVALKVGCSPAEVHRIEKIALLKLRHRAPHLKTEIE